jgi:hypothetical protein
MCVVRCPCRPAFPCLHYEYTNLDSVKLVIFLEIGTCNLTHSRLIRFIHPLVTWRAQAETLSRERQREAVSVLVQVDVT